MIRSEISFFQEAVCPLFWNDLSASHCIIPEEKPHQATTIAEAELKSASPLLNEAGQAQMCSNIERKSEKSKLPAVVGDSN